MDQSKTDRENAGRRAWMEIDREAVYYNICCFDRLLPAGTGIMAVVKADAYGHGAAQTARYLEERGIGAFAVATASEGVMLRRAGIAGDILILGYTNPVDWEEVLENRLIQTIVDESYARQMSCFGCEKAPLRAHLAVDTGMHRLGVAADNLPAVREILALPGLAVEGIFSHLCVSDSIRDEDVAYTLEQIREFDQLKEQLEQNQDKEARDLCYHLQSSYGALNYPGLKYDYIRLGIAMYGAYSSEEDRPENGPDLRPAMAVRARVAMVRQVEPGAELGYGRAYKAASRSEIATVAIGYADGIPRSYGEGRAQVLIHGKRCPVVGRICMDQMLVDVTGAAGPDGRPVETGDVATLIGRDGMESITAEEAAGWCRTITNELLCRMGGRLERLETADRDCRRQTAGGLTGTDEE